MQFVYNNTLDDANLLKFIVDCEKCGAKRFQYEVKGSIVVIEEQETSPELIMLDTFMITSSGSIVTFHLHRSIVALIRTL
jgi:hypothetical protein